MAVKKKAAVAKRKVAKKKVVKRKAATAKKKVAKKKRPEILFVSDDYIEGFKGVKRGGKDVPPAYFLSLSVENVRCFGPKQTIDVSDGKGRPAQWTVILGDNNTGKTTLLQCFVALEPVHFHGITFVSRLLLSRDMDINLHRNKERDSISISGEACYSAKVTQIAKKYNTKQMYITMTSPIDRKSGKYNYLGQSEDYYRKDLAGLICYGYGASRVMGDSSLTEKTKDDPSASLLKDDIELINAEEWLLQADYAAMASESSKLKEKAGKKRDQIREVLINLLPEVNDIRVVGPTMDRDRSRVEFKTPYGWVALNGLSLGYRAMITWMVDLANRMFERYPKSPNPLAEPAVVLVDEIDLHLHPKWQRTLMDYLSERFVNTQFIVTAHSPLVVQAAKDANVVLLKREDDHVVIDNKPQSVRGWRADQILTTLFELESGYSAEIEELQKERRKILSKAKLTDADKDKLKEIESKMGDLPTAETAEDIEAMNIIRRAAKALKK